MVAVYNKFNRGEIDDYLLARQDFDKVRDSGSYMLNWLPARTGPMYTRPGLGNILEVTNGPAYNIPFVRDIDDKALLEMTAGQMRVIINDTVVSRTSTTTTLLNGDFAVSLSNWSDGSGAGSSTSWVTGGKASLTGTGGTAGILYQTSGSTQFGKEHALRVVVDRGPVKLQIGTDGVGSEDIYAGTLKKGVHSLVFTPDDHFTVSLSSNKEYAVHVSKCALESAGELVLDHSVGVDDLKTIRYSQSADVVFCTRRNGAPFRIERRGTKSWSITDFQPENGPFGIINTTETTLTPGALTGDTTLTASADLFNVNHIGSLWKVGSKGQTVTDVTGTANDGTDSIIVTGKKKGSGRIFNISIVPDGSWSGTITLQQSLDDSTWTDVQQWTTAETVEYNDRLDNQEIYYRLWVKTGDYSAGTVTLTLTYPNGSIEGVARVIGYSSPTSVDVQVLTAFGATTASRDWYEGQWSDHAGWPSVSSLYEGRFWLAGPDIWGSESDNYESFDRSIEGDSASIFRSVGFGPVPAPHWLESAARLVMGITTDEILVRSDTDGSLLTPNNTNVRPGTNQGVAPVAPVRIDSNLYFVQRSGTKLMVLSQDSYNEKNESADLTLLNQRICSPGIKRIAFTRQPETRVYCVLDDGTARVFTFDRSEEQSAWSRIVTGGDYNDVIEDVVTLPGLIEDTVYMVINRPGVGRYLEKMALTTEARGETESKHFDGFKTYNMPGTEVTDMWHLEGRTVRVWMDGQDVGEEIVSSGVVNLGTLGATAVSVVIGMPYNADWKSNKLNTHFKYSLLTQRQRVSHIGLIARSVWLEGLTHGPTFSRLEAMPSIERGTSIDKSTTQDEYDNIPVPFAGSYDTDGRICLRATGPATLLALTYEVVESSARKVSSS